MEFMQLRTASPSDRLHSCSCSPVLPHSAVSFPVAHPHGAAWPGPATPGSAAMEMSRRQQRTCESLAGDGGVAKQ